jgi:acyl-coenzyme A synthetase/AMP-(fatty) acid ligase/acyl carrier protein
VTIVGLLRQRALERPDRIACGSAEGRALTYLDWQERSAAAAGGLTSMIEPGDRVALAFSLAEWNDYAVAYMAVAMAAGVCVPVAADSRDLLQMVDARLSIGSTAGVAPAGRRTTLEELTRAGGRVLPRRPPVPTDLAEILFTSGTTGPRKPVAVTHANLSYHLCARRRSRATPAAICHATAFASNAAQTMLIEPLGSRGRTVVSVPVLDAAALSCAIARFGVTELIASPATLITLAGSHEHDLSAITRVYTIAAPITAAHLHRVAARFPRASVVNVYTSTEVWPARTTLHLGDGPEGSVGRPRGGSQVAILGADDAPLETGATGDVALLAPHDAPPRFRLGANRATAGPVRTGDVGYLDEDGFLHLVDRDSDVINVGGVKIYSLEVEAALTTLAGVLDAAVVGVRHQTLGEYAVAAVVLDDSANVADLRQRIRARLGARMTPHDIVKLSSLPRNAGGKVDKRALRDVLARRAAAPRHRPDAADGLLDRVKAAWEQALDLDDLDRDDNFFACGGSSLLAMRIVTQLADELDVELPTSAFFDWTTIAEMADVIRAALRSTVSGSGA